MYDPLATMERVTEEGRITTANTDAHFWKNLPKLSSGRKVRRILFDHHTLQNRFYFTNGSTEVRFMTAMPMLKSHIECSIIHSYNDSDDCPPVIAFPDGGAHKKFYSNFEGSYDSIICGKKREGSRESCTLFQEIQKIEW